MCLLCVAAAAAASGGSGAAAAAATAPPSAPKFLVAGFVKPVLFKVLGINFYSYGVMVALALALAFTIFGNELRRARIELDEINCFFIFLAGFGIGSKAHVALSAVGVGEELSWKALDIRTGHSFMGSIIGAVVALLIYVRWHKVKVLDFLDVLLPCCLLGHSIGKVGCFLSGDGCYGPPADPNAVPWAMSFPNGQLPTLLPVHPTPIYESACSFLVFASVRGFLPLPKVEAGEGGSSIVRGTAPVGGRRTSLLLVLYGVERVCLERYRRHPPIQLLGSLTEYQVLALALLLVGVLLELWARRSIAKGGEEGEEVATEEKKRA